MNTTDRNPTPDPSIRKIEEALNTLGAAERARARGSLEQDILRASRPALVKSATTPPQPSLLVRIFSGSPAIRIAAVIGVVMIIGLVTTNIAKRSRAAEEAALADAALQLDSFLDDASTAGSSEGPERSVVTVAMTDSLVDLKASVAAAELSIDDFWVVPDDDADPLGSELESSL